MLHALLLLIAVQAEPVRVVALPLRDDGAGPELTNAATSLTAVALSKVPGWSVLSGDDVKASADVEAQKQLLGCDEAGCLAEIAQALGADRIVHGNVARLGQSVVVTLSLFDAKNGASLGRESVQARDEATLPHELEAAVQRLSATDGRAASGSSAEGGVDWLLVGGLAGVGVGAVAAGAGTLLNFGARDVLASATSSGADKTDAAGARPLWGALAVGGAVVALAGVAVAGASFVVE
jgi:TolB-like protein